MTRDLTSRTPADRKRVLLLAGVLTGVSGARAASQNAGDWVTTASVPEDYRLRHPIAVTEADRSIVVFVGRGRGGLSATQRHDGTGKGPSRPGGGSAAQREDVTGMAQSWLGEGTGGISIDMPVNTPNARAAADSLREIQATLAAAGVPPRGRAVRPSRPEDPNHL